MQKIKNSIPNTITSLNAFSGCLSVVFAFEGKLMLAGIFIFIAAFLDFFDGLSARLLNAYSDMGKELDSLADMLSFGFAPAVIAHLLIRERIAGQIALSEMSGWILFLVVLPFLIAVFSGLRLAKFNVDTRQSESFIGLATPANAMVWASLPMILKFQPDIFYADLLLNVWFLPGAAIVMSLLLVSELPMFSLKFKNLKLADNKVRFGFLVLSTILLAWLHMAAIPVIIICYILISLVQLVARKN